MKKTAIAYITMSLIFAALGAWTGWYATSKSPGSHTAAVEPAHDDHDDHEGHDHGAEGDSHDDHDDDEDALIFSAQALSNMGVTTAVVEEQAYTVGEYIPATIVETPLTEQPVVAPVGGFIASIDLRPGQRVDAGVTVATIVRDALPRPTLALTQELLQPASEEFHSTKAELRETHKAQELLATEIARLEALNSSGPEGLPLIPRQELVNLRYEQAKLAQRLENLRLELRLHGLEASHIAQVEAGEELDFNLRIWRAVLARNGYWSEAAETLLMTMPEATRQRPWVIATIGELVMQDLVNTELMTWMAADELARRHVLAIAGLLMDGQSLTAVQRLAAIGALEPTVTVPVPAGAPDWDVHAIHLKVGDRVEAGQALITVANPRTVYLDAFPVGSEVTATRTALVDAAPIDALPLVDGSGPALTGLTIQRLAGGDGDRPLARLQIANSALRETTDADGRIYRSWALRPGLRYMLRLPVRQMAGVLVVPADAVVDSGADKIVYVLHGEGFVPRPVELLYRDHADAVLGSRSRVFPGDQVVVSGAFALNLAQRAASGGAVDPHAGHNH